MIPVYPKVSKLTLTMRPKLHPLFQQLTEGISEFTFANLYLFRTTHNYSVSLLADNLLLIAGEDGSRPFFMLPFGLPEQPILEHLFQQFGEMKCVSQSQMESLQTMGYATVEDRKNFDYLYLRQDLAKLAGRKFHKKRNLIKAFLNNYSYEGRPLLEIYKKEALQVLDSWRSTRDAPGDYAAAREALENAEELQLCGAIYSVQGRPVAYSLGEELSRGKSFVIHFEKASNEYKGLWQFVNQAFASILSDKYETINREQDLGSEGMRKAKLSYKPMGFVKKYKAFIP
jgi:uncharacterized protein